MKHCIRVHTQASPVHSRVWASPAPSQNLAVSTNGVTL